ncbi:MAG: bifunctional DNA primase/polymerase [Planctomycetia bacterium]|nr:MAG: bifunctional DNA primase/polymerase [Planctomycetia bacterium]
MESDNAMLQAARWYAELGYAVFPCAPGRKTPLTEHGLLDATTDAEQIAAWWMQHPRSNIAIRTDGLVIIDVDGEGNTWLTDEPAKLAELDVAPLSLTPRGGRHYIFRQPEGRAWRNSTSRLAPRVDTRANGGYVLIAPSVVEGRAYRWANERGLAVAPHRLPEPPAWLIDMLDALAGSNSAVAQATPGNAIPKGQRNGTMARLGGAMRRVGMSQAEILAALQQVNADRCAPPLALPEVERIASSIARYEPDAVSVALTEDHWAQDHGPPAQPAPLSVRELMATHRMLRAPVIHGLLRRGETMNVIASPKTGKSWLVLALAMAVATGRHWLDAFETVPGRVLIIDNELHPETLAHRIPQVAECLHIGMNEIAETISVQSLRGQLRDIFSLGKYFESVEPGTYALVVLDAFYRFMPRDMDENDNGTMAGIYNHVDALADRVGCSFVLIHHATKGNQSAKSVTDVGAGAGSQSRATDTHLVLRPHEQPGAVVLEAAVRSWPPVEPMALRWLFPLWKSAPDLDPAMLRSEKAKRAKPAEEVMPEPPAWSVERFVEEFLSEQPATRSEIRERATGKPGLSWRRVSDFLDIAEHRGLIQRIKLPGQGGPVGFAKRDKEVSL